MTLFFSNEQITIRRAHNIGGLKYAFSATFTVYSADIQPSGGERINQSGGRIGKTYDAFVDASVNIKEGDQIKTANGKQYVVKAVSIYSGADLLDHIQLIIEAQD